MKKLWTIAAAILALFLVLPPSAYAAPIDLVDQLVEAGAGLWSRLLWPLSRDGDHSAAPGGQNHAAPGGQSDGSGATEDGQPEPTFIKKLPEQDAWKNG